MDMKDARRIVAEADTIRALFAPRNSEHVWDWHSLGLAVCLLAGFLVPLTLALALRPGPGITVLLIACAVLVPLCVVLGATAHFARLRESQRVVRAAHVGCPRCGRTLRDDGPSSWTTCDATERACPDCGTVVKDDAHAAATLRGVRETYRRRSASSPLVLARFAAPILIAMIPVLLVAHGVFTIGIDTTDEEMARIVQRVEWLQLASIALVVTMIGSVVGLIVLEMKLTHSRTRAWFRRPTCLRCAWNLEIDRDASLTRCASCGDRYSVAQMLIDDADSRNESGWALRLKPLRSRAF